MTWHPAALAQGHPGLALTFAELAARFPGEGWGTAAHRQIELAVEAVRSERRPDGSLFGGLPGVAFAAALVDADRYARLLGTLDRLLREHTERGIERLDRRERGSAERDFDVVSGLAGLGAYFLLRGDDAAVRRIVGRLVDLILAEGKVPNWYTPPELLDDLSAATYPHGRLNCGLAHGLPGPLALLALARVSGVEDESVVRAVQRASTWLVDQVVEDEWGVNWPYAVSIDGGESRPARAAWCYGAPGIARTLWLAGTAIGDSRIRDVAVAALEAVAARPASVREADAPTFCHGLAGLLHITLRTANDSGSGTLRAFADELLLSLLDAFEPDSIFGYRDLDPDGGAVDRPGLLQGAAGVVLVLLAAGSGVVHRWDRVFLVA